MSLNGCLFCSTASSSQLFYDPQKEDYGEFALDRKACVVTYRKMQSKRAGPIPEDLKICVHGLEGSLSLEVRELTADRRAEIVQEVLHEQERHNGGKMKGQRP